MEMKENKKESLRQWRLQSYPWRIGYSDQTLCGDLLEVDGFSGMWNHFFSDIFTNEFSTSCHCHTHAYKSRPSKTMES